MSSTNPTSIHRHLDAIFADVPLTPEAQDLKEEIRGNLSARAAELEDGGLTPERAASKAVAELGDVDELLASVRESSATPEPIAAMYRANKVRPRSSFVLRTIALSAVVVVSTTLATFAAVNLLHWGVGVQVALAIVGVAVPAGLVVDDSLRQETTASYPLPRGRAAWYGVATTVGLSGLAMALFIADVPSALWPLAVGVPLVVASGMALIFLGTTQSNRKKAWVREAENRQIAANRFESDPAAAARFGLYAGAIWIVVTAAFVVMVVIKIDAKVALSAFLVGVVATIVLLARMQFGPNTKD